jgi:hypothetical protein
VADASGSLPGACFAARRAEARWPLTTSPLARQDITAAVEGTVWARTPARRARTFELKRPRQWCGALCPAVEELEHIRNTTTNLERLEQDRDALLSHYSQIAVEHLDNLEPEKRNRVYKMLDLKVLAHEDGNLEVKWTLGADLCGDNEPLPPGSSPSTTPAFRFSALLTDGGAEKVELVRV